MLREDIPAFNIEKDQIYKIALSDTDISLKRKTENGYTDALYTPMIEKKGNTIPDNYSVPKQTKSISGASVTGILNKSYTGRPITQSTIVKLGSSTLKEGRDYTVTYNNNKNAGTSSIIIRGKGNYTGVLTRNFKIEKAKNTLIATEKIIKIKYSKLKKKKQVIRKTKAFKISKAQGTVTFQKTSGNKKITVNKKTGKITIKKGLKKGTYKVKVNVTAAGSANYKALTKTVTVKIKIR